MVVKDFCFSIDLSCFFSNWEIDRFVKLSLTPIATLWIRVCVGHCHQFPNINQASHWSCSEVALVFINLPIPRLSPYPSLLHTAHLAAGCFSWNSSVSYEKVAPLLALSLCGSSWPPVGSSKQWLLCLFVGVIGIFVRGFSAFHLLTCIASTLTSCFQLCLLFTPEMYSQGSFSFPGATAYSPRACLGNHTSAAHEDSFLLSYSSISSTHRFVACLPHWANRGFMFVAQFGLVIVI